MKALLSSVGAVLCLASLGLPAAAQTNSWNGSWKADPASLKYEGGTYTVATDADGYTVTTGGQAQPKIVCDGKPHKTNDTMTTCTKLASGYALTVTRDGKQVRKTTITVSADGNTRTGKSEFSPSSGSPYTMTTLSKRVSGGPGFAGEWKEIKTTSTSDNGMVSINVKGDTIAFKETDTPKPIECKLDGTETKTDTNTTMAVKLADPHTLKVTYRADGKIRRENTFVLSQDGKTITETDVTPAPSVSKLTLKLHKM
jgi:hypothetical protein